MKKTVVKAGLCKEGFLAISFEKPRNPKEMVGISVNPKEPAQAATMPAPDASLEKTRNSQCLC